MTSSGFEKQSRRQMLQTCLPRMVADAQRLQVNELVPAALILGDDVVDFDGRFSPAFGPAFPTERFYS